MIHCSIRKGAEIKRGGGWAGEHHKSILFNIKLSFNWTFWYAAHPIKSSKQQILHMFCPLKPFFRRAGGKVRTLWTCQQKIVFFYMHLPSKINSTFLGYEWLKTVFWSGYKKNYKENKYEIWCLPVGVRILVLHFLFTFSNCLCQLNLLYSSNITKWLAYCHKKIQNTAARDPRKSSLRIIGLVSCNRKIGNSDLGTC